jgi:acetyl/propionyl-CoA carboxylase alpha subunit
MKDQSWTIRTDRRTLEVARGDEGFTLDGNPIELRFEPQGRDLARIFINGIGRTIHFIKIDEYHYDIWVSHDVIRVQVEDSRFRLLQQFTESVSHASTQTVITAPMPGLVTKLHVKVGDAVAPGSSLIILEAMKMENEIRSKIHGAVKKIEVDSHASVEKGQTLIILETLQTTIVR